MLNGHQLLCRLPKAIRGLPEKGQVHMRIKLNCHGIELWTIVPVAIIGCFVGEIVHVTRSVQADASTSANTRTIALGSVDPGSSYALTVAVKDPSELHAGEAIDLIVK